MTDYRKGSMGEAEQKSLKTAKIVMGIATVLLFALCHLGLFHTYLSMWTDRASGTAKVFGILFFVLAVATLLAENFISEQTSNETIWYVIWVALLLGAIATSGGFNFAI